MLTKFKQSIYNYVVRQLMMDYGFLTYIRNTLINDEEFVKNMYVQLENERVRVAAAQAAAIVAAREERVKKLIAKRLADIEERQNNCKHLKGGAVLRGPHVDFNIWIHTFPGEVGSTVKCLICGKVWKGDQLKYPEVIHMMQNTTNTPTASEISIGSGYAGKFTSAFQDRIEPQREVKGSKDEPTNIMDYIIRTLNFKRKMNKERQGF